MTVAELIIELRKLDQSMEVWIDSDEGLFPTDMVYENTNTVIITYSNDPFISKENYN